MATATDLGVAYEKSDKSILRLLNIRCTSFTISISIAFDNYFFEFIVLS